MLFQLRTHQVTQGILLCIYVLLMSTPSVGAQYTTGRVEGVVMDPAGAVIPGATVTLRNVATNITRTFKTGPEGAYVFTAVPPGPYEVSVEAPGFAKAVTTFEVFANQTITKDLRLAVAGTAEVMEVVGEPTAILNVADAQHGITRTRREVTELPLLTRDYLGLANLAPGVQPTFNPRGGSLAITSGSQAGFIAANGGRARATAVQLDYTDANDWEFGGRAQGRNLMPDAIQEFTVLMSNFPAEYGVKSNAQVVVVTKSGTNNLHGTAYDFIQNDVFNARDFFDRTGKATILRRNNYGFTVGGPIVKDRTFAFGGYEGTKIRGAGFTAVALVPTQAARATATDPVVIDLMKRFLPLPTGATSDPNVGTFTSKFSSPNDSWQFVIKADHKFSESHFFSARYLHSQISFLLIFPALNTLPGFDTDFTSAGRDISLSDTLVLSPRTTNQLRVAYGRANTLILSQGGLTSPRFTISGLVSFGALQFFPNSRLFNVYQVNDVLTHVRGSHTLKMGADIRKIQDNTFLATNSQGFFIFPSLASFLAGQPSFWTQLFGNAYRGYRTGLYGFFFQDDWKVTRTFTLNLGLRWETQGAMSEVNELTSVLDPQTPGSIGAAGSGPLGTFHVGNPAIEKNPFNLGPRFGFAWNPGNRNFVLRGGYGVFFDSFNFTPLTFSRSVPPLNYNFTLVGSQISGANSFSNIINGTAPIVIQARNQIGTFGSLQNFGEITTLNLRMKNPYAQHFSLATEYRFLRNYVFRLSYIGTKGTNLTILRPVNPVVRRPAPATSLADEAARLAEFRSAVGQANGVGNSRLDPRFDQVSFHDDGASSIYHSLQLELSKSFSNEGLQFIASYTWSKSIDDASDFTTEQQANDNSYAQNAFARRNERAVSNFDIPHRVVATLIWQVPFFRNLRGVAGKLLDGWTFQSINMWQSGVPGTLLSGSRLGIADVNLDGNFIPRVGLDNTRANCDPRGRGFKLGDPSTIPPPNQRGIDGAPNSSNFAFTQPLLGNDGTCGRNTLRMNSFTNFDWSFFKNIQLAEKGPLGSGPWTLQFRAELFNVFNIPFLTAQGNAWRTLNSPGFGLWNAAAASRRAQLALKLLW